MKTLSPQKWFDKYHQSGFSIPVDWTIPELIKDEDFEKFRWVLNRLDWTTDKKVKAFEFYNMYPCTTNILHWQDNWFKTYTFQDEEVSAFLNMILMPTVINKRLPRKISIFGLSNNMVRGFIYYDAPHPNNYFSITPMIHCESCGILIDRYVKNQKYCSKECKEKGRRQSKKYQRYHQRKFCNYISEKAKKGDQLNLFKENEK